MALVAPVLEQFVDGPEVGMGLFDRFGEGGAVPGVGMFLVHLQEKIADAGIDRSDVVFVHGEYVDPFRVGLVAGREPFPAVAGLQVAEVGVVVRYAEGGDLLLGAAFHFSWGREVGWSGQVCGVMLVVADYHGLAPALGVYFWWLSA